MEFYEKKYLLALTLHKNYTKNIRKGKQSLVHPNPVPWKGFEEEFTIVANNKAHTQVIDNECNSYFVCMWENKIRYMTKMYYN